ncbi:hypothetical protein IE53DRAFT_100833 [Violaceomyces palustris]|uniref:Uncharacterized protein n=1 Tax=Violaceomyces palustris TaxID=1673888 RepID=A0ACD0P6P8_9BASI|nr:hypothetical protein IE53DRAFT_100833 [Violaceomyces palustris]
MSSDARSLLRKAASERVKSQVGGITDPSASYNVATGALRCSACNFLPIKHESLWSSHAASKSHRSNVQKTRSQGLGNAREDNASDRDHRPKRKAHDSDASVQISTSQKEEDREAPKKMRTGAYPTNEGDTLVDSEWELFQQSLKKAEKAYVAPSPPVPSSTSYESATIEAGPVLKEDRATNSEKDVPKLQDEETAEEKQLRLEREEKEEIYARFEEEQRLQDEAYER